jgi:hypothetical protein
VTQVKIKKNYKKLNNINKVEAIDKKNPTLTCVATITNISGNKILINFGLRFFILIYFFLFFLYKKKRWMGKWI